MNMNVFVKNLIIHIHKIKEKVVKMVNQYLDFITHIMNLILIMESLQAYMEIIK